MLRHLMRNCLSMFLVGFLLNQPSPACTNLLVTKGASADGSVIITYTCDGEFHPRLRYTPPADYPPGEMLEIKDWSGKVRGTIPQVEHTYAVVGRMNEHQLAISETTFDGRLELQNPDGLFHYFDLMKLALQRAHTARDAIKVMTELVEAHGYRSTGESFSIADTEEAWILEMIGPGPSGAACSRRLHLSPCQQGAHQRVSPERPGKLPVQRKRHQPGDRKRVLRSGVG